ncbi:outer membrane lipoprotein carrier protein LolA [Bdellovibrio bacteriovorus]|uniref:LolA family protein n=1 Tax=Bdellovibrio bacteriovorus TaxID=959 RepID=UPI0021D2F895|nr:outer membrane lipoprotein carrier protein LolA [Bdellovibrio bacteriovorus]UXR65805.1 outer membrane lipoprotein carrier protein LolA [Bdellovibrio bacteriovorus]
MVRNSLALLFTVLFSWISVAATAGNGTLQKVGKKYRASKLVEMSVEKIVKSELLGKETKYEGKIYLANGKFRWENTTPEQTLLVFDGSTIWSVQTPPKEFGGPVQVAKGKVDKKTRSHILISSLLGEDLAKTFKIVSEKKDGDLIHLDVEPVQGGDLTVKSMKLVVKTKDNTLRSVSYLDDIGNQTTMNFSKIEFLKKENKKLFKYQPPKDAQVTDL